MADVSIEETRFRTWDDCLRLSNGTVELVATTGIGPRVLACGFADGENLFSVDPDKEPVPGKEPYRIYGGHRLWHAPEDPERTYVPDNEPVRWEAVDGGVRLVQPTETETGVRKTVSLRLSTDAPVVTVTHELRNEGAWPVELAPWAITVLRADGTAVVPLSRSEAGLVADRSIALWPYTNLADDRFGFADEALVVEGDPAAADPVKVGASGADEWAGAVVDGVGFVKEFACDETATYPDRGSAVEVYADESGLELETLGPLQRVEPGESAVHTETWRLVDGVDATTPAALRSELAP